MSASMLLQMPLKSLTFLGTSESLARRRAAGKVGLPLVRQARSACYHYNVTKEPT